MIFYPYFFPWESDLKIAIFLKKPQRHDIVVGLRLPWWGLVSENLMRSCTPIPRISLVEKFFKRNFWKFSSAKIFSRKVSRKKIFSRKDAYRVTWLGRKKLGHRTCTPWARNWKWQQTCIFGHFWPDPQIGFLVILGKGCAGAGRKHGTKFFVT